MPLATVHLSLRETCPKRGERAAERCVAVRGPEAHEVLRLAILNAPQLHLGRRLGCDALRLRQQGSYILGADGIVGGKREPGTDPPCRKARQVHDSRGHKGAIRHDDLTAAPRPKLRGADRELLAAPREPGAPDSFTTRDRWF